MGIFYILRALFVHSSGLDIFYFWRNRYRNVTTNYSKRSDPERKVKFKRVKQERYLRDKQLRMEKQVKPKRHDRGNLLPWPFHK